MTEEEAKTKWCPAARFKFASTGDGGACNREGGPDGSENAWLRSGTRCIGSACMAWRWEGSDYSDHFVADDETIIAQWSEAGWRASDERNANGQVKMLRPLLTQGFCGLAGKP